MEDKKREIARLKARIEELENEIHSEAESSQHGSIATPDLRLPLQDYRRYGRQMILDGFGLPGQLKLADSSVLVVGAGGLGCPALQYLAAAGIGTLGIIDHDTVDLSNLQRQILHSDAQIGWPKTLSAKLAINRINPSVKVVTHDIILESTNAIELLKPYSIILDCTDNAPTRYLLSDVSSRLGMPLVSGAAMRYDGQLCVYNLGDDGPCYRCLFPVPPIDANGGTCEEVGVLGVVTGVIGTLQAMEAIKIIVGSNDPRPSLLLFSALSTPPFRTVKIRPKKPSCLGCGPESKHRKIESEDYVAACGGRRPDLEKTGKMTGRERISAESLHKTLSDQQITKTHIIDVRPAVEFGICHLPQSKNVPLTRFLRDPTSYTRSEDRDMESVVLVCRLGNDSQVAASSLRAAVPRLEVKDLIGGLKAWSRDVDGTFPIY